VAIADGGAFDGALPGLGERSAFVGLGDAGAFDGDVDSGAGVGRVQPSWDSMASASRVTAAAIARGAWT